MTMDRVRFACSLGITVNDVAYWFSLLISKGSNKGYPMPETIIGDAEGCAKKNNA
jgi:hypothetical protein